MKRFLLRIQTYLRKLAGVPVSDEMPLPQSDIEKSLYEICKNNPNGIMPGIEPSGTISITENGTYDVREFAEAKVEVEEPQGLVDLAVNYIDSNRTLSAIVENNEVKNFTASMNSLALWIPLRKPFVLNNGDIITLGLDNVNNGGYFWDVDLIMSFGLATQILPVIPLITNQRIVNGRTNINYSNSTIPVFGIRVLCRNTCSGCNLKISLAINGKTLF